MTSITDLYPHVVRRGHRRELLLLCVCVICFLLGLVMVTPVSGCARCAFILFVGGFFVSWNNVTPPPSLSPCRCRVVCMCFRSMTISPAVEPACCFSPSSSLWPSAGFTVHVPTPLTCPLFLLAISFHFLSSSPFSISFLPYPFLFAYPVYFFPFPFILFPPLL